MVWLIIVIQKLMNNVLIHIYNNNDWFITFITSWNTFSRWFIFFAYNNIITNISDLSATNYNFTSSNGTLTITKAIINVIADNKSRVYNDNNPTLTFSYNGFLNNDDSKNYQKNVWKL